MKILVVEDEPHIASFVRKGLEEQGFSVDVLTNGNDAWERASTQTYDALVLDIMLPGRDGLSVLRKLRKEQHTVPVLLLTARSELEERVEGLELGADDYLTKPFFVEELVARLHAIMRRVGGEKLSMLQLGDLVVNLLTRDVKRGGRSVDLTSREFNLLAFLMRSPERVQTRTQILEHVWEYYFDPATNIVDVYIQRLRKKLCDGNEPNPIETVRGVGYRMTLKAG